MRRPGTPSFGLMAAAFTGTALASAVFTGGSTLGAETGFAASAAGGVIFRGTEGLTVAAVFTGVGDANLAGATGAGLPASAALTGAGLTSAVFASGAVSVLSASPTLTGDTDATGLGDSFASAVACGFSILGCSARGACVAAEATGPTFPWTGPAKGSTGTFCITTLCASGVAAATGASGCAVTGARATVFCGGCDTGEEAWATVCASSARGRIMAILRGVLASPMPPAVLARGARLPALSGSF